MALSPLRPSQQAAEQGGAVHRDLFRWLHRLLAQSNANVTPIGAIVPAKLSAADVALYFDATGLGVTAERWAGWAVCNGNNGTPSLDGKFPRFAVALSGGTGGSDSSAHTHDINHDHGSFASGDESAHTHAAGGLYAQILSGASEAALWNNRTLDGFTASHKAAMAGVAAANTDAIGAATAVGGTSAAGSAHNHAVDVPALGVTASGAASATENRPAYYELVPVMRVA